MTRGERPRPRGADLTNAARAGADELAFTSRKVEEEIRAEVGKVAAMLKAFWKLEQQKPASGH